MLTNYETVNSIRSSLGVRYTTELSQGSVRYVPQAAARYQHEFGNGTQLLTSSFQGAPAIAYATAAANTGNDFGLFTLGGTAILSDRHTLYANVDAQIAANYRAIIGSAGFQFSW